MICIGAVIARSLILMAALALAAGCNGKADGGPETTLPPPSTASTTPPDPYAVPAVIDEAYVNRVLAGLDAANGDVLRLVVRERTIPQEVLDRIDALYVGEFVQIQRDLLAADLQAGFSNVRPSSGNRETRVSELITASPNCIFARVNRDYSPVVVRTNPRLNMQWVMLRPLDPARDPHNYNPTPWIYVYDGFQPDGTAPPNRCIDR